MNLRTALVPAALALTAIAGTAIHAQATQRVAFARGNDNASVSGTVRRLADQGLVSYERYRGVRLTDAGQAALVRLRGARHEIEFAREPALSSLPPMLRDGRLSNNPVDPGPLRPRHPPGPLPQVHGQPGIAQPPPAPVPNDACPACGTSRTAGRKFCMSCGKELDHRAV